MSSEQAPRVTIAQFEELLRATVPLVDVGGVGISASEHPYSVLSLGWGEAVIRVDYRDHQLRAGGTLSGPTMMTLADTALYAAVLTRIGYEPLAVTSDLNIRFLRKPAPKPLIGRANILRLGRKLAVGTVEISSEGEPEGVLVAHATGTYAIP